MFQMMGVFAEFERAIIVERVRAGLARARADGKRLGRPSGLTVAKEVKLRKLLGQGVGVVKSDAALASERARFSVKKKRCCGQAADVCSVAVRWVSWCGTLYSENRATRAASVDDVHDPTVP